MEDPGGASLNLSERLGDYCSRFFAKALPECDFKYLSNSKALYLSWKAQYQTNSHGVNFSVCDDFPAL